MRELSSRCQRGHLLIHMPTCASIIPTLCYERPNKVDALELRGGNGEYRSLPSAEVDAQGGTSTH
eukprot:7822295-Pyramimonas_sp.AAC.1